MPRRARFRYARIAAALFAPLFGARLRPPAGGLNSDFALMLRHVMDALTERGLEVDFAVRVRGTEAIADGPALYVTAHFSLSVAGVHALRARGIPVALMRSPRQEHLLVGTRTPMRVIVATETTSLVQMRNALRGGESVAAMLDDVESDDLAVHLQPIEIAARSGFPVVFFAGRIAGDGAIEAIFERPRASDTEGIARELLEFIQRHRDV